MSSTCEAWREQRPDSDLAWRACALFFQNQSFNPSHSCPASQLRSIQLNSLLVWSIPVTGACKRHEPTCRPCKNTLQHLMQWDGRTKSPTKTVAFASLLTEQADTPCAFAPSSPSQLGATFRHIQRVCSGSFFQYDPGHHVQQMFCNTPSILPNVRHPYGCAAFSQSARP